MIIELHLLQSFPVSNLNRDDVGQPKTATFGGHTRGRISSQCLKRSARNLLCEHGLIAEETGVRTKRLLAGTVDALAEKGRVRAEAEAVARQAIEAMGLRIVESTKLTEYLLFVGRQAISMLAEYCEDNWAALAATAAKVAEASAKASKRKGAAADGDTAEKEKPAKPKPNREALNQARRILDASSAVDIALFGRMVANNKDFNVNAASQVAHAISTHAVINEYDYYTAVDDLKPEDQSGADMIGTVDFNAACYYRYANLDLTQLTDNLSGDSELAQRAARAWLGAFIHAVPSGKQNSMAARTMPETLLAVVRSHGAWNLANAFLTPVTGDGLMRTSTERLADHFHRLRQFYRDAGICTVTAASLTTKLDGFAPEELATSLDAFVTRTLDAVKE